MRAQIEALRELAHTPAPKCADDALLEAVRGAIAGALRDGFEGSPVALDYLLCAPLGCALRLPGAIGWALGRALATPGHPWHASVIELVETWHPGAVNELPALLGPTERVAVVELLWRLRGARAGAWLDLALATAAAQVWRAHGGTAYGQARAVFAELERVGVGSARGAHVSRWDAGGRFALQVHASYNSGEYVASWSVTISQRLARLVAHYDLGNMALTEDLEIICAELRQVNERSSGLFGELISAYGRDPESGVPRVLARLLRREEEV